MADCSGRIKCPNHDLNGLGSMIILDFQECENDGDIDSDSESEYSPSESSHASDNEFTDSDDEEEEGPDGESCSGGLEENQADTAKPKTPRPDTPWKTRNTE